MNNNNDVGVKHIMLCERTPFNVPLDKDLKEVISKRASMKHGIGKGHDVTDIYQTIVDLAMEVGNLRFHLKETEKRLDNATPCAFSDAKSMLMEIQNTVHRYSKKLDDIK